MQKLHIFLRQNLGNYRSPRRILQVEMMFQVVNLLIIPIQSVIYHCKYQMIQNCSNWNLDYYRGDRNKHIKKKY